MIQITDEEYPLVLEKVVMVTKRNFAHTMQYIESTLNISRYSPEIKDRELHFLIRGAILQHGKNLKEDIITEFEYGSK